MTTLAEVHAAWDKTEGEGRDEDLTRSLADAYVEEHPDEFTELSSLSLEDLVKALDVFRAAGLTESVQRIDCWLWHHFEPQNIGGPAAVTVRVS
jgi:hypothetical protein